MPPRTRKNANDRQRKVKVVTEQHIIPCILQIWRNKRKDETASRRILLFDNSSEKMLIPSPSLHSSAATRVGLAPIIHDLNFLQEKYEATHTVTFKNPSQALQERLRETGPLPNDDDRQKKKTVASKKGGQKYDYEKIAEALEKLDEEDLLRVIQLINENKGPDTYIRSDVEVDNLAEAGEFSIDLYTMPDMLTTKLWEHLISRVLTDATVKEGIG
ncbi:putative transcription initiation factor IIF 30K chain [Metarhizium acridum CQMa 102]|uniref:Putative transcription initiation factor IIF 30K chain n=1 Tax=Metarhizium acridum (strain CQMa 102) TaxID=655827 RepID=E9DVJ4_METAQ|nr:putative transcription initiation factor IIF 30K chain [Metarhizium acridum CQMa 102]EFY92371.1 putative transcription initiation factor IIF 30K chain [Metarhizium acridum CQMa 102]